MRQLIFLAALFLLPLSLQAQTINVSGVVLSASTGQAIAGASVQEVKNPQNGTLTDSLGRFSISVLSGQIVINHLGYESVQMEISTTSTNLIIGLVESSDLLNSVVISGNKTEKRLKELTMSLEVLRQDLVSDKNPVVIDEIMQQIPGVNVTDGQVSIRSGSGWSYGAGSRVTVLVDGAPIMNGDAGNVLWSFISQDHIGSVEVLKGASSVLYGSSALNGIINISTKWPTDQPQTSVSLFGGSYSKANRPTLNWSDQALFSSGLRIGDSRKFGKSDLNTNLEYVSDDGYRFGDYEKRFHAGLDWRYRLKGDMYVGARLHLLNTESASFLLWKSYDSAYNALDDAATVTDGFKLRVDPFFTYRTDKNWLHKINSRVLRVVNNVDSGNPNVDQSNSANTYYVDYQISTPKKSGWQYVAGVLATGTSSQSPLFGGDQQSSNIAAFAQMEVEKGRLIYSFGARMEHYKLNEYVESKPVIRSGLNYRIGRATFGRASFGQGYRFPTIAESFIETKVGVVSVFSNNQLRSETGWNAEVGVKQGFKLGHFKGFVDVAAFNMHFNNMMEFTFSQWSSDVSIGNGLGLGFKSVNTGKTEVKGIDFSLNGEAKVGESQIIRILAGYTYSNPRSLEPHKIIATDSVGNDLNYINTSSDTTDYGLKYRSRHLYKFDVYYSFGDLEFGLSHRYNSFAQNIDKKFVEDILALFIPGIAEGQKLNENGDHILDIRAFYNLNEKYRIGVIVSNLLNNEFMVRPGDLGPPRLTMIQLRARL